MPEFEIKLDAPVAERYEKILKAFNSSLPTVYHDAIEGALEGLLGPLLKPLSNERGKEDPEMQEEVEFWANATGLPYEGNFYYYYYSI